MFKASIKVYDMYDGVSLTIKIWWVFLNTSNNDNQVFYCKFLKFQTVPMSFWFERVKTFMYLNYCASKSLVSFFFWCLNVLTLLSKTYLFHKRKLMWCNLADIFHMSWWKETQIKFDFNGNEFGHLYYGLYA
jgi:hypothetical protein